MSFNPVEKILGDKCSYDKKEQVKCEEVTCGRLFDIDKAKLVYSEDNARGGKTAFRVCPKCYRKFS